MRARATLRSLPIVCALFVAQAEAQTKPVAPQIAAEGATSLRPPVRSTSADTLLDEPLGEPQFNTTPNPLPPNLPSVGFEATATSEFGDLVRLAGTEHFAESVTVALSSHALRSDFPGASPLGFSHPLTLRIFAVDRRAGNAAPGALLVNLTQSFLIPWRPEAAPDASSPLRPWRASNGTLYTGLAFTVNFTLGSSALSLPHEVIVALSFDTEHQGVAPKGVPGPYNFLHVAVTNTPPAAGANVESDAIFWKTAVATNYSDDGTTGVNVLRRDTGWSGYQPVIRINDSPYGMLAAAAATLRALPTEDARTVVALVEASDLIASALDRSLWDGNTRLRSLWGRLVFDLLAEAADELMPFANSDNPIAPGARTALDTLMVASQSLVETAVGDAVIGGGDARRIARAQDAFDTAATNERTDHFDRALSQLASAWREAELSLR